MKNRLKADIYCIEPIPCNPCETSCPFDAIAIGDDITTLPVVDADLCRGCGICLAICPGLTIRLIDPDITSGETVVAFPYEYEPMPEKDDVVDVVSMQGQRLGLGVISRIQKPLKDDPTRIVYVQMDASMASEARSMRFPAQTDSDLDLIVCRCEEVTLGAVLDAIDQGDRSLDAIKRRTRAGMGLCQGKTCSKIIAGLICQQTGLKKEDIGPTSIRQPVNPISLATMASTCDHPLITDFEQLDKVLDHD